MDSCPECGFDYRTMAPEAVAARLRALSEEYGVALAAGQPAAVRARPDAATWSALEYACHVRDVLLIQRDRVLLTLVEDNPGFKPMYRDHRVGLAGYAEEEPAHVVSELATAANLAAKVFGRLTPEQLERPCVYNYPQPSRRDVAWLGLNTVHEMVHHLGDVRRVLGAADPASPAGA